MAVSFEVGTGHKGRHQVTFMSLLSNVPFKSQRDLCRQITALQGMLRVTGEGCQDVACTLPAHRLR